jgi:hypothetical protein
VKCAVVVLLVATFLVSGATGARVHERFFEYTDYPVIRRGLEGTGNSIRPIDPDSLRPLRRGLRLGAAAASIPVASPDGRRGAVGLNFGELVIVDMQRLRLTLRLQLASPGAEVNVITWPRPDLIVTLVCDETGKYGCLNDRLVLVNPREQRTVARVALDGDAVHWVAATKDLAAVLVSPENSFGPVRVVTIDERAFVHTYNLDRLSAGERSGTLGPTYLHPEFALSETTASVFVPNRPVALVELRTGRVRYRRSPGLWRGWSDWRPGEAWTGTIEPRADVSTLVQPTWPGIVGRSDTDRTAAPRQRHREPFAWLGREALRHPTRHRPRAVAARLGRGVRGPPGPGDGQAAGDQAGTPARTRVQRARPARLFHSRGDTQARNLVRFRRANLHRSSIRQDHARVRRSHRPFPAFRPPDGRRPNVRLALWLVRLRAQWGARRSRAFRRERRRRRSRGRRATRRAPGRR